MIRTTNPTSAETIKQYEFEDINSLMKKINAAQSQFEQWKEISLLRRKELVYNLAKVLRDGRDQYARMITLEMGKPISESRNEVEKCAWMIEVFCENCEDWLKPQSLQADGLQHQLIYEPLGVILGIMPWNFPFWQAFRFAIPALLSGNTCLLKHAPATTETAFLIEKIFVKAGLPNQSLQTILAGHEQIEDIIQHHSIAGVSLTGSTRAGSIVGGIAGKALKKVVLELGGSDPFIVLKDAPIAAAVAGAVASRFLNCGQSCIAAKRIYVHKSIYSEFKDLLAQKIIELKVGDPFDEGTQIGPLVSKQALSTLEKQVIDAQEKGAQIICGGKKIDGSGFFYRPTLIDSIDPSMEIYSAEVFGPVACLYSFDTIDEVINLANQSDYGLGSSVWTGDLEVGKKIAQQLQCGCAFVNSMVKSDPRVPFGGRKKSGLGRELSILGMREFTNIKALNVYSL